MPGAKGLRSSCATRYHFEGASLLSVSLVASGPKQSTPAMRDKVGEVFLTAVAPRVAPHEEIR